MRLRNTHDMGLLLQSRRKALGWSQARLAHQLGITRQWVIALEKGTPGAAVGTVLKAFTALGLMLDANHREANDDSEAVSALRSERVQSGVAKLDIDEVIKNARSGTGDNLSITRQPLPLPLSRSRRKKRRKS